MLPKSYHSCDRCQLPNLHRSAAMKRNPRDEPNEASTQPASPGSARPQLLRLIRGLKAKKPAPWRTVSQMLRGQMFKHRPLDQSVRSIRLITILPDLSWQGYIHCSMHHTTINCAKYTCLSYEWGSEDGGGEIYINGKRHGVRQNLLDFLRMAQVKEPKPPMWIDALCIDQENNMERSHQLH